jgi:SAM-dependent methyltransferase
MKTQLKSDSTTYVLESREEATRLEAQSELPGYRLDEELRELSLLAHARVLDAGCGSGLLSRYLLSRFPTIDVEGCDFSEVRVKQAQNASKQNFGSIRFFQASLEKLPQADQSYDHIFCRYVLEHLTQPEVVCREFYRVLKPGGSLTLIDFDGLIFNFHSENMELMGMLNELRLGMKCPNLFIGREIRGLLARAGFDKLDQRLECVTFGGDALLGEQRNTEQRFTFATPIFTAIFGTLERASRFSELYCSEMVNPRSFFFYNKFIVTGKK